MTLGVEQGVAEHRPLCNVESCQSSLLSLAFSPIISISSHASNANAKIVEIMSSKDVLDDSIFTLCC